MFPSFVHKKQGRRLGPQGEALAPERRWSHTCGEDGRNGWPMNLGR